MSYHEENGQVVLTMSREDYEKLSLILDLTYRLRFNDQPMPGFQEFVNRLNSGNPNYTPYQVGEKTP